MATSNTVPPGQTDVDDWFDLDKYKQAAGVAYDFSKKKMEAAGEQERKTISDQTVEEYLAEKEIEYRKNLQTNLVKEALRLGIGKLLR